VKTGRLENDGEAGTVVTFSPKTVTRVQFTVDDVRPGSEHAGLGEMAVYAPGNPSDIAFC